MAYIPPHKRHSKDGEGSSPSPSTLIPQFQKKLNLRKNSSSSERRRDTNALQGGKILYARDSISRLYVAASTDDDDQLPSSIKLEPISLESVERRSGEKPLVLVSAHNEKEVNEVTCSLAKGPWISVAEKIHPDLLSCFQNVRKEMDLEEFEEVKPLFVARFGNILFHGSPSTSLDTINKSSAAEAALDRVKKSFYTNVSNSYMETILGVVPKNGFDFDEEKENYQVKVLDKSRPNVTISSKCTATNVGGELEPYKFELNQVRHLVVDVACLDTNLDLRLMLTSKKILTALTDDEKLSLRNLIKSAVLDPGVKGGLRWPLGKSFGDRYCIVGVWHMKAKSFKSPVMRITLRHADRFDFRTSTGEVANEVILKMTGIVGHLKSQKVETSSLSEMLQDNLKLIWNCFLSCECSFT